MTKNSLPLLTLLAWLPAAIMASAAMAAPPVAISGAQPDQLFLPASQLAPHQKTIHRIEEYLSSLTTIVSDFTQVAPDGTLTTGKFYLQRPGRMRWQYNPPTPILMVSNGSELVYYDYELEQVSHIPLDSTLIGFLAQPRIRFDNDVGIVHFSEDAGAIRIEVAQTHKPDEGRLTLEFSDNPLLIRNMIVVDSANQVTTVSLNNAPLRRGHRPGFIRIPRSAQRQGTVIYTNFRSSGTQPTPLNGADPRFARPFFPIDCEPTLFIRYLSLKLHTTAPYFVV